MIEKPYRVMLSPPDSAGGWGRQLLAASNTSNAKKTVKHLVVLAIGCFPPEDV